LSSPVPLTLSLWLITAAHTRALALQASMRLAMSHWQLHELNCRMCIACAWERA
jgi:hypothetical protein